ncbi:MAG: methyltransferase domain-containing protein [Candidatus Eremiobacteraeota bacterium]|nr:methyltransferase domain-containing protein [Candidatus Eremiobacteraeota bacterium]
MARRVLVSLLWPKNAHVLGFLVQHYGFDIAIPENQVPPGMREVAASVGGRIIPLATQASADTLTKAAVASERATVALPQLLEAEASLGDLDRTAIAQIIARDFQKGLHGAMALVDSLDELSSREDIAGVLLNETDLAMAKTAALWAKARQIPSFLLSHGSNIGATYTITNQMLADYLLVFGERGMEPYLDMGIPADRIVVTGNPAWDGYGTILHSRNEYRKAVYEQLSLKADAPLVVFATTWNAKLTALQDKDIYENTLRAFLKACAVIRSGGFEFNVVVKDRPSNAQFGREMCARLAQEEGMNGIAYADGDMPVFLCAADVLVGYDSNAFVEAMICGIPAIGIWAPSSWLLGPALDRRDAIPLVQVENPSGLADVLQTMLGDSDARRVFVTEQHKRLPFFHAGNDGKAGERAAAAVAERISSWTLKKLPAVASAPSTGTGPRYVWHELSDPRTVAQKGGTQEYYDHARPELINLLTHTPRVVLDIGCGGGATGLMLKKMYPHAVVTGVELSEEAATLAATRVDRVLRENVETLDFESVGYSHGSIDTVFLPDVLEHLYDPWKLMARLKPFLSKDSQVLASIPNVRNLWLITELLAGRWQYEEEGLLDVTHIRFFTLQGVIDLFAQTGYSIERLAQNADGRVPVFECPEGNTIEVNMPNGSLKGLTPRDVWELRTLQFLVDAKPA